MAVLLSYLFPVSIAFLLSPTYSTKGKQVRIKIICKILNFLLSPLPSESQPPYIASKNKL